MLRRRAEQQRGCFLLHFCRRRTHLLTVRLYISKDMLLYLCLLFSLFIGAIYNIQWYRQYQRSRPEFLLYITEAGVIHPTESDFSAHIDKTEKRVDLEIISAAVTDSAVYYLTGNTNTLYKNLWRKDNTILHNIHQRESLSDKHQ
ncbi:hypothetical protein F7725_010822 [Dissostichus mawsoni]|uniref:Immunoglobulin V-set domain-containing protein n=1 Tax=Dissostichus mawsoni TaxID=36200 RepID=A0A7J5Z8Y2_DISMA|nr:hypothetical protein F7725_010822 [Dissostichus mawsoni]